MPSNSKEYSAKYYQKRRLALIKTLGGKCFMCGKRKKLVIHRIYKIDSYESEDSSKPTIFDADISNKPEWKELSKKEVAKRAKELYDNTDNMVLLCPLCHKYAIVTYGRKTVIGRRKLHELSPRL